MFLSGRDLEYAVDLEDLIVSPRPESFGASGIDLHLDTIDEAKVWDVEKRRAVRTPSIRLGHFDYKQFAEQFAVGAPLKPRSGKRLSVYRADNSVIVSPGGFFLWQTKEAVGTPTAKARYICFINGKSTRARLGLLIHMTAPTIDAGWWGKVTLEIANLGPFEIELREDDAIAQLVVAMISSPPQEQKVPRGIAVGQQTVTGGSAGSEPKRKGK
jgi:dCTP deaminase